MKNIKNSSMTDIRVCHFKYFDLKKTLMILFINEGKLLYFFFAENISSISFLITVNILLNINIHFLSIFSFAILLINSDIIPLSKII